MGRPGVRSTKYPLGVRGPGDRPVKTCNTEPYTPERLSPEAAALVRCGNPMTRNDDGPARSPRPLPHQLPLGVCGPGDWPVRTDNTQLSAPG